MKYADFEAAHRKAKAVLLGLQGDDDWPGLSIHDRAYEMPVDWQGERYTALVRASNLSNHASCTIPVDLWHWHWRGGQEGKFENLTPGQLRAVADIKEIVRRWIDGEIDELPPSTGDAFRIPSKEATAT